MSAQAPPGNEADVEARPTLLRDALVTIASRLGLAVLIFATDIALARLLGPAAKGRFVLVLLYSQLAAVVLSWGIDSAAAVVAGRDIASARRAFANAVVWSVVVGGASLPLSALLLGIPSPSGPSGPLAGLIPNLSGSQFLYGAIAIPLELFFAVALFVLVGRRAIVAYSAIRVLRRLLLLLFCLGAAAFATLSLDVALVMNIASLVVTAVAIVVVAARDRIFGLRPSPSLLVEQMRFGSSALVGTLAERLLFRADAFLVNAIVGVAATGVYSVTSGLAETLWYVPNALGIVMFSRAVDPEADAGRIAATLTRTSIVVTLVAAVPAFVLGPTLVELVYGQPFVEAGLALRWILPGVIAYSVVAVLSRYIVGQGRPGLSTVALVIGLGVNIAANVILIPQLGIAGAAISSSLSYTLTAAITLVIFLRLSGLGLAETLILRRSDLRAFRRTRDTIVDRLRRQRRGPIHGLPGSAGAAALVIGEHDPGEEP